MPEAADKSLKLMTPRELIGAHTPELVRAMKVGRAEIWLANAHDVQNGKLESIPMAHQNVLVIKENAEEVIQIILTDYPELNSGT